MRCLLRAIETIFITTSVMLLSSTGRSATITLKVSSQNVTAISTQNVAAAEGQAGGVKLIAEGALYQGQPGEPDIPWQLVTVLLPPNADLDQVSVRLENASYKTLEGNWQVEPAPPMGTWDPNGNPVIVWPQGRVIVEGRDTAIYTANAFWPTEVRLTHTGGLHQWQLAEIAVPLVRYNPVTGQLEEMLSANVAVNAARSEKAVTQKQRTQRDAASENSGQGRVRRLAANFKMAAGEYDMAELNDDPRRSMDDESIAPAGVNSDGYVIITTNSIVSSSAQLANFVAHKQARGWNVTVVTETQWGGGTGQTAAANIRNWLRANYISMDILYVLLIGNPVHNTGNVPMQWYDNGDGAAPTDMLYSSDLDADGVWDKYWEVIVGRIPYYGTMSIVDAILQKTILYENSQQIVWRYKMLLPMVPLADDTPSYQCGEQIRRDFLIPHNIPSTRIYDENYDEDGDGDYDVIPEYLRTNRFPATEWASQPYGLVAWVTHGSWNSASGIIATGNVNSLNDYYPSVVYQGSCSNADPNYSGNLAFRILQKGSINTVGGTRTTYYRHGQTNYAASDTIGSLGYRYSQYLVQFRQSCGMAVSNAKQHGIMVRNCLRMVTYGDPSVVVLVDPDFTPPMPDPMTWQTEPYESGAGRVTMKATTAVDNAGTVQYYFDCVSGGGHDSGWQSSPTYTDTYVTQLVNSYRVKARDNSDYLNETGWSPDSFVTISPYPYLEQPKTILARIQAEHFNGGGQGITYNDTTPGNSGGQFRPLEDVDIAAITDGSADYAVDQVAAGEWLLYTVNSTAAETDLYVRVASTGTGGQIRFWLEDNLLTTVIVPNTGSMTTWQTVSAPCLPLPGRENAMLKVEFVGSGFRLNWFEFGQQRPYPGVPFEIPERIEFEDYDMGGQQISFYDKTSTNAYHAYRPDEPVDIMSITDEGAAGYAVYAESPEWLEYTCNIAAGYYTVTVRSSSTYALQQLTLLQGERSAAVLPLPNTGGWSNWQNTSVANVYLEGGNDQVLRFVLQNSNARINRVEFVREYDRADITRNGQVNMDDFSVLAAQWLGTPGLPSADIAPAAADNIVDFLDVLFLAENWLFAL